MPETRKQINKQDLIRALALQGMYINELSKQIEPTELTVYLKRNNTTLDLEIEKINLKTSNLSRRLRTQALVLYETIQKSKQNVQDNINSETGKSDSESK